MSEAACSQEWVYFVRNMVTHEIKIGFSRVPDERLMALQTGSPHDLVMLGKIPGSLFSETILHARFSEHRIAGEWFSGDILPLVNQILGVGDVQIMDLLSLKGHDASKPARNFLSADALDKALGWHSGMARKFAKKRKLPHYRLPDGSMAFDWAEIEKLIVYVPAVSGVGARSG